MQLNIRKQNKNTKQKIGRWSKHVFPQRHINGQKAHKKMLNITKLLEKCVSKMQWGITSLQSEWSSSKYQQEINSGENVEKREHSCTVGGNVIMYNHYGEQYRYYHMIQKSISRAYSQRKP